MHALALPHMKMENEKEVNSTLRGAGAQLSWGSGTIVPGWVLSARGTEGKGSEVSLERQLVTAQLALLGLLGCIFLAPHYPVRTGTRLDSSLCLQGQVGPSFIFVD